MDASFERISPDPSGQDAGIDFHAQQLPSRRASRAVEEWKQLLLASREAGAAGKYGEAIENGVAALSLADSIFEPRNLRITVTHHQLADLYRETGRYVLAESHYQQAIKGYTAEGHFLPFQLLQARSGLGVSYFLDNDFAKAASEMSAALCMMRSMKPEPLPEMAACLSTLARALLKAGQVGKADRVYRAGIKVALAARREPVNGIEDLAALSLERNMPPDAVKLLRHAVCLSKAASGTALRTQLLVDLANSLHQDGRLKAAVLVYRRSLREAKAGHAVSITDRDRIRARIVAILQELGFEGIAQKVLQRVICAAERRKNSSFSLMELELSRARLAFERFDLKTAEAAVKTCIARARAVIKHSLGAPLSKENASPEFVMEAMQKAAPKRRAKILKALDYEVEGTDLLGVVRLSQAALAPEGRASAMRIWKRGEACLRRSALLAEFLPHTKSTAVHSAFVSTRAGVPGPDKLQQMAAELLAQLAPPLGSRPGLQYVEALRTYADACLEAGDYEQAGRRYMKALELAEQVPRIAKTARMARFHHSLGAYFLRLDSPDPAVRELQLARRILSRSHKDRHPLMLETLELLAQGKEAQGKFADAEKIRQERERLL